MAVIHLDGQTYEASGADNLLAKCLSLGLDVPYFCWHPSLGSVGSCRQCAVKQYNSQEDMDAGKGRIVMSCMVETTSDLYISIDDEEAKAFRARITELLMTNHPHDCPTCEEGGHCHLQDMTVMTGHDRREYRFTKRTHENQYLGPFIAHEMNRCIACYRCTRYYNDYAGGKDLGTFASASRVYFGRETSGVLESEFSGNLTEVCPTGVFTDKSHSDHYTRKWDMQYAPSVCAGCSLGCNTSMGERYGEIRRVENRYNPDVNGYFLCDAGRFGYDQFNSKTRPLRAQAVKTSEFLTTDQVIDQAAELIRDAKAKGKTVAGLGSATASLETNFALKQLVGAHGFYSGHTECEQQISTQLVHALQSALVRSPSLKEVEAADVVLILGEDVTQTAPRLALSIRQASKNKALAMTKAAKTAEWLAEPRARIGQNQYSPIYVIDTITTKLDDVSKVSAVCALDEISDFADQVKTLIQDPNLLVSSGQDKLAKEVAQKLIEAKNPLIVSGASQRSPKLIQAAFELAATLTQVRKDSKTLHEEAHSQSMLFLTAKAANDVGLSQLQGKSLEQLTSGTDPIGVLVVAEHDLQWRLTDSQIKALFARAEHVVALDWHSKPWHQQVDLLIPAASVAESDGTFVSATGRAQRFFQVYEPSYYSPQSQVVESWRWLHAIETTASMNSIQWHVLDDLLADLAKTSTVLAKATKAAPTDDFRISGLKVAREPRRYSGRTSLRAPLSVHEPKQPQDQDTALTFSMEGYVGDHTPSALIPFAHAPGWNSPQSWNKFQSEVGGALKNGESGLLIFSKTDQLESTLAAQKPSAVKTYADQGGRTWSAYFNLFATSLWATRSPLLKDRAAELSLKLSADVFEELGLSFGDQVEFELAGQSHSLNAELETNLLQRTVLCPGHLLNSLKLESEGFEPKLKRKAKAQEA